MSLMLRMRRQNMQVKCIALVTFSKNPFLNNGLNLAKFLISLSSDHVRKKVQTFRFTPLLR